MLIIGRNLEGLVKRHAICDSSLLDQFSLKLKIGNQVRRMKETQNPAESITYARGMDSSHLFDDLTNCGQHVEITPNSKLLGCSDASYKIPAGYFGIVQTKGTLARLFVSCTCNDGQIEPGYQGKITLEIMNQSNYNVILPVGSEVAQVFIFKCSGDIECLYNGKYQGATNPTLAILN